MADPVASATGLVRGAGSDLADAVLCHAFVHNADPVGRRYGAIADEMTHGVFLLAARARGTRASV